VGYIFITVQSVWHGWHHILWLQPERTYAYQCS